jgi:hypothetical protein
VLVPPEDRRWQADLRRDRSLLERVTKARNDGFLMQPTSGFEKASLARHFPAPATDLKC